MTARDHIFERIHGAPHCEPSCPLCREVDDLLDEHEHDLAERQRRFAEQEAAQLTTPAGALYVLGIREAADRIDPEVNG